MTQSHESKPRKQKLRSARANQRDRIRLGQEFSMRLLQQSSDLFRAILQIRESPSLALPLGVRVGGNSKPNCRLRWCSLCLRVDELIDIFEVGVGKAQGLCLTQSAREVRGSHVCFVSPAGYSAANPANKKGTRTENGTKQIVTRRIILATPNTRHDLTICRKERVEDVERVMKSSVWKTPAKNRKRRTLWLTS
jgi:hypothetical protein